MKWYPWLTAPYKNLIAQYSSGRGHHAILLHVPEEYGEDLLANAVGRWLMCTQPQGEKTCGHCRSCQLMNAGTHPDWHEIVPEKGKAALGVEQIRQLTDTLYEHAQQGGVKAVWISNATLLTDAAANALLKTLEEPPSQTYFMLGCLEPRRLLATIRSRCLYWPLVNPDETYSCQWLAKQHPDREAAILIAALRLAGGSPLKASELLNDDNWQRRSALMQAMMNAVNSNDFLSLLPMLNQDDAPTRLAWCTSLFMDAMKQRSGAERYVANQDWPALIQHLAAAYSADSLQALCQRWLSCRHQLLTISGVNKELLLGDLLLKTEQGRSI